MLIQKYQMLIFIRNISTKLHICPELFFDSVETVREVCRFHKNAVLVALLYNDVLFKYQFKIRGLYNNLYNPPL